MLLDVKDVHQMRIKIAKIKNKIKKKNGLLDFLAKNKSFTIFSIIFIFGFIIGSVVFKNSSDNFSAKISSLFLSNFEMRKSLNFFNLLTESTFSSFIFILVIFLMGLSAIGLTLIPPIVFLKGYCLGILQIFLCEKYGLKGFLFELLILLPGTFISLIATILMAKEAIKISNIFSSLLLNISHWQNNEKHMKNYLLKTGFVLILVVVSAFVDVFFNFLFLRFFSF